MPWKEKKASSNTKVFYVDDPASHKDSLWLYNLQKKIENKLTNCLRKGTLLAGLEKKYRFSLNYSSLPMENSRHHEHFTDSTNHVTCEGILFGIRQSINYPVTVSKNTASSTVAVLSIVTVTSVATIVTVITATTGSSHMLSP